MNDVISGAKLEGRWSCLQHIDHSWILILIFLSVCSFTMRICWRWFIENLTLLWSFAFWRQTTSYVGKLSEPRQWKRTNKFPLWYIKNLHSCFLVFLPWNSACWQIASTLHWHHWPFGKLKKWQFVMVGLSPVWLWTSDMEGFLCFPLTLWAMEICCDSEACWFQNDYPVTWLLGPMSNWCAFK